MNVLSLVRPFERILGEIRAYTRVTVAPPDGQQAIILSASGPRHVAG